MYMVKAIIKYSLMAAPPTSSAAGSSAGMTVKIIYIYTCVRKCLFAKPKPPKRAEGFTLFVIDIFIYSYERTFTLGSDYFFFFLFSI